MAIKNMECPVCGYRCESIRFSYSEAENCPKCGKVLAELFTPCVFGIDCINVDLMDTHERQMLLEHKRFVESRSEQIKNGQLNVKLKGPRELRPNI